ncbi:hypothetical protein MBLNU457_3919t1 [Dothideomycetes sp. NU457]
MAETAQPNSIAQRIAALKLNEVGRQSGGAPVYGSVHTDLRKKKPPPPPPPRPVGQLERSNTTSLPVDGSSVSSYGASIGNRPAATSENTQTEVLTSTTAARLDDRRKQFNVPSQSTTPPRPQGRPILPPRQPTNQSESSAQEPVSSPPLPPRRPSEQRSVRRGSAASTASAQSSGLTRSSTNEAGNAQFIIRAPSYDPSTLPKLPPRRQHEEPTRPILSQSHSSSSLSRVDSTSPSAGVSKVPSLPSRTSPQTHETLPKPRRSALSMGFDNSRSASSAGTSTVPVADAVPPPVPMSSRPDLSKLLASKPKMGPSLQTTPSQLPTSTVVSQGSCLRCRDFSAVDAHAARFPRQSIPSTDLGWLAHNLCSPFPSLTDKARVLFTWLHHNIDYNVRDFFARNLKPSTPASTISTGLAVCEGYAGLFAALAAKAGLEAIVVGGHGKGYGFSEIAPGAPVPPLESNHAWSAVRIDGGVWKLIDTCWGAGHLGAEQTYNRKFAPEHFVKSNEEFGETHYPADRSSFFRADGRRPSWEEYLLSTTDQPSLCSDVVPEEGLKASSFAPKGKKISLSRERQKPFTRFVFERICEHWDPERNGKGKDYCYILSMRENEHRVPLQTNGLVWWVDVRPDELGAVGQMVRIMAVTNMNGQDARGVKPENYVVRCSQAWRYVSTWELVA